MNEFVLMSNLGIEIMKYRQEYKSEPNAVLVNEDDLHSLEQSITLPHYVAKRNPLNMRISQFCGLKVIPIKHGKLQVLEVIE